MGWSLWFSEPEEREMDYRQYTKRIVEKATQNPDLPPPQERTD